MGAPAEEGEDAGPAAAGRFVPWGLSEQLVLGMVR